MCVCCCRYGDDWFEAREEDEILPQIVGGDYYRVDDPATGRERVPGCPHQTTALDYVSGGLRARRGLAAGEVIEVARALLLPPGAAEGSALAGLVWRWHGEGKGEGEGDGEGACAAPGDATCQADGDRGGGARVLLALGR